MSVPHAECTNRVWLIERLGLAPDEFGKRSPNGISAAERSIMLLIERRFNRDIGALR